MDQAHLHLVLNHFPILGTLFGAVILLIGAIKKNKTLQKAGLITLVLIAIITIPAFMTGEAAEHATEHLAGSSHDMVHEHEELAELGLISASIVGVASLALWFLIYRNRHQDYTRLAWAVTGLAFGSFFIMMLIGNHGGKIRRPELRGENVEVVDHHHHEDHEEGGED
jgi:uncharacterized membrane protein